MRLSIGQAKAGNLTSDECLRLGRELFKIDCGFAFTRFITSTERRKSSDIKKVPTSDIIAGLSTVAHAAKHLGGLHGSKSTELEKRLKSVASAANRIVNKVRKSGLKSYEGKELDEIVKDVEKSSRRHLDALQQASLDVCLRPLTAQNKKERAS